MTPSPLSEIPDELRRKPLHSDDFVFDPFDPTAPLDVAGAVNEWHSAGVRLVWSAGALAALVLAGLAFMGWAR